MREEKWGIEDLLERLEAAELLIAFATVQESVFLLRRSGFQLRADWPAGPAFQDDYQATIISGALPPSPTICLCQLRTSVESANGIIFRVTFEQMSREHALLLSQQRIKITYYVIIDR